MNKQQDGNWTVRGPFGGRWPSPEVLPSSARVQFLTWMSDFRRDLYCYKMWNIEVADVLQRTVVGTGRLLELQYMSWKLIAVVRMFISNRISLCNRPAHLRPCPLAHRNFLIAIFSKGLCLEIWRSCCRRGKSISMWQRGSDARSSGGATGFRPPS